MKTFDQKTVLFLVTGVFLAIGLCWGWVELSDSTASVASTAKAGSTVASVADQYTDLSDTQIKLIKVEVVSEHEFAAKRDAVGSIAFNDDRTVQVFPSYQGKIVETFTDVGRDVKKGEPLYSVDSPDLLQAESALISAAGTRELTTHALVRAKQLFEIQGIAQKDLQQAIFDQQSAEGAYKAARDAVRIFGKTETEIDRIVAERHVDAALLVRSPISGRVTTRSAAPGTLTQPGTVPAPFTVADISVMWMMANVAESDVPALRLGQRVEVKLMAYPDRVFQGKITNIGASVDQNTHSVLVRSEIRDVNHELRSGMLATFIIRTGESSLSSAMPFNGVVREGNGNMTVWVTTDLHRFFRRSVTIGLQQDGVYQVITGLKPGEMVATEGAIFLSHAYEMEAR